MGLLLIVGNFIARNRPIPAASPVKKDDAEKAEYRQALAVALHARQLAEYTGPVTKQGRPHGCPRKGKQL